MCYYSGTVTVVESILLLEFDCYEADFFYQSYEAHFLKSYEVDFRMHRME